MLHNLFRCMTYEGPVAGVSTGANLVAALRVGEQLEPGATVVTVLCDTGMKYLKTFRTERSPVGAGL